MPEKITSKNLSYNSSLPPFLRRLHAQASGATGPDPLLAGQRRQVKKRSSSEEAEDAPLVVDEHGNRVDVEFEKDGTVKESQSMGGGGAGETSASGIDEKTEKQNVHSKLSVGPRKRKVGKAIGIDASDTWQRGEVQKMASASREDVLADRKVKKKVKKIKLSFDEDEDEG